MFTGEPRTTVNLQFRGLAVDKQGSHCHCGFELEGLPIIFAAELRSTGRTLGGWLRLSRNRRDGEGDGIVLDAGFGFGTKAGALGDEVHQFAGYGNLALGLFGQRHADGVANAFGKQGANAHCRLDASVFTLASLCDTQMQRVVHVLSVHRLDKQTDGSHHDDGIRSLDADDHIVELLTTENAQELNATLDNTLGGVSVTAHDAVRERTVIHTDADSGMVFLADIDKRNELALNLLQFLGILFVGILQMLESTSWVDVVARIDANLLAVLGSDICRMSREVDVSH